MSVPIQSRTRLQIRQAIGRPTGLVIVGACSSTGDNVSLLDTYGLALGGTNEYRGRQVYITESHGSGAAAAGDKTFVSSFASGTSDATLAPALTGTGTVDTKGYEMWKQPWLVEDIHDLIDQAVMEVTRQSLQVKETHTTYTDSEKYEYDSLSSFVSLHKVEYVNSKGIYHLLDNCDTAWTAGSANVTVTADSSFEKIGSACVKAVEDGSSGTNAILCYKAISSVDISDCDKVEFWMYSSIALTAGQLQIHLDDTAAIASGVEKINIPAMTAATWYKHSLSLANPHSDTAIISIGIFQVADVGAFTFYVDEVEVVLDGSKIYKALNPEQWDIVKGSTDYLKLNSNALSLVGEPTQIRLNGLQIPSLMTADTSTSEVDPNYIIAYCIGHILVGHAKSSSIDIDNKANLAKFWLEKAETRKKEITTIRPPNTRFI